MLYSSLSLFIQAAQMIKEALDKRFGTTWHVVVGEGFGFDISYELSRCVCCLSYHQAHAQALLHVLCWQFRGLRLEMLKLLKTL